MSHHRAAQDVVACTQLLPLQDGNVVHFKAKRGTQFRKLMKAYCERQSFQPESVVFMYDGERLRGDQTPADVSISWLSSLAVWPKGRHPCEDSEATVGQADAFRHGLNIVCALVQLALCVGSTEADSRPAPSVAVCSQCMLYRVSCESPAPASALSTYCALRCPDPLAAVSAGRHAGPGLH